MNRKNRLRRMSLKLLITSAALTLAAAPALAVQKTWTGSQSQAWGNSLNWSPAGVPLPADTVLFGSSAQTTVQLGADRAIQSITFDSSVGYTLEGSTETLTVGDIDSVNPGSIVIHTINTNVALSGAAKWHARTNCTLEINGSITGTAAIDKRNNGLLVLAGNNTGYTGEITVLGGELEAGVGNSLSNSTNIDVQAGATLRIVANEKFGGISGFGDVILAANATVGGSTSGFSGTISGLGALFKINSDTFELFTPNVYQGATEVRNGTLALNNSSGSATGTGAVEVQNGATLGGTGISTGLTTVLSGGTIAPGNAIGILELGDVAFDPNTTLSIEIGGTALGSQYDQLLVTNTATLGGTLDLTYDGGFTASSGDSFIILQASNITGTFDSVNFPDGQNWWIDYGPDRVTLGIGCGGSTDCNANGVPDYLESTVDLSFVTDASTANTNNTTVTHTLIKTTTALGPVAVDYRLVTRYDNRTVEFYAGSTLVHVDNDVDGGPDALCDITLRSFTITPEVWNLARSENLGNVELTAVFLEPLGCHGVKFTASYTTSNDCDGDCVLNECETEDCDNNGVSDDCDLDGDGDGVNDACDACEGFDDLADVDGDGIPDGCDPCDDRIDTDGDGIGDACDPCPGLNDPDADGDGICDALDQWPGLDDQVDCNSNSTPDYLEVNGTFVSTASLSHFFTPQSIWNYVLPYSPEATGDVAFSAFANAASPGDPFGSLFVGGVLVQSAANVGSCLGANNDYVIPQAIWNAARVQFFNSVPIRFTHQTPNECFTPIITLDITVRVPAFVDCDNDGVLDECETDCDGDGAPDECEFEGYYTQGYTGELALCDPEGEQVTFNRAPPAVDDVTVSVGAVAQNIGDPGEEIELYLNNVLLDTLFTTATGCFESDSTVITAAEWNTARQASADGTVTIEAFRNALSCAGFDACFGGSFSVNVEYNADFDANANGWLDRCLPDCNPIGTDSDGDGISDDCDACPGTIPDASIVDAVGCVIHIAAVDGDSDGDVDADDFAGIGGGLTGPDVPGTPNNPLDVQQDDDLDLLDVVELQRVTRGRNVAADPTALGNELALHRLVTNPGPVTWELGDLYAKNIFGTHMAAIDRTLPQTQSDQLSSMQAAAAQDPNASAWIGLRYAPAFSRWGWSNGLALNSGDVNDWIGAEPGGALAIQLPYVLMVHLANWQWINTINEPELTLGLNLRNFVVQLPPTTVSPAPQTTTQTVTLTLTSPSDGQTVAAGTTINWSISFTVSNGDNDGLALLVTDLEQDAGNPELFDVPQADSVPFGMLSFATPGGISNPPENGGTNGYMGVQRGSPGAMNLAQIGGAQNNLGEALPGGVTGQNSSVVAGVGQGGSELLASGSFVVPTTQGTYVFNLANAAANVFDAAQLAPLASEVVAPTITLAGGSISFTVCSDSDTDGVCDSADVCPGFDDNLDTDGDTIPDGCDACAGGAASGDSDANGATDMNDYVDLETCLSGPSGSLGTGCECFDFDSDGDADVADFAKFQVSFTGS